jgi:hypothetical protein
MNIRGEVETADFGDKRLSARLVRLAEQLVRAPDQSFPKAAGSDAALEATYRFLGNESVTPAAILEAHAAATRSRCAQVGTVLVSHDSTEFRFSSEREGLGRLGGKEANGFMGHFALAVSPATRAPLGVLGMEAVFRERGPRKSGKRERRPLEEKESRRWLDLVRRVAAEAGDNFTAVHVMDREADAYELLAAMAGENHRFIVRLQFDRAVDTTVGRGRISDVIRGRRTLLTREVTLSARVPRPGDPPNRAKKHPSRKMRAATLRVSALSVTIRRPSHLDSRVPASLRVNVVRVQETTAPQGVEPVEWRLITTEPVETAEDVAAVVDGYRARWVIEEYFRALKQGCSYEKRQLESRHALLNALAVFAPIAWQLLALRQLSRDTPDMPADSVLSPLKISMLQRHPDVKLGEDPSIRQAMLAIARLGGHIKNNGEPGWLVLGRGYEDLLLLERGAALALGCDQS